MTELEQASRAVVTDLAAALASRRDVRAIVGLFSGGNDSTAMVQLMHPILTHLAYVNTGTGVQETSQFVRATAARYGLPLLEVHPPDPYEHIITGKVPNARDGQPIFRGFPGPGQHHLFYQRLKERALFYTPTSVRGQLITGRGQAIIYVAGRRAEESRRRKSLGSRHPWEQSRIYPNVWWASPMLHWAAQDVTRYLAATRAPLNQVAQILHMSAECLCGCYAKDGELDWIGSWYPQAAERIQGWQQQVQAIPGLNAKFSTWGWGKSGICQRGCNV